MRDRTEIVKDIVSFKGNLNLLQAELSKYPWDLEEPIFQITNQDILNVIDKTITNDISFMELEDWANLIECRDDFSFEKEELQEIIFQLANPLLYGGITDNLLKNLKDTLKDGF